MKKYAVVIGINEYKDQSIGKLSCAANDAKVIGECLQDVCKFDDVRLFISGGDNEPTNDAILQTLSNLAPHLQEDDLFLFYFAGHGIHTEEGSYLLTCNSLAQFPSSGSLSMKDLERCFSNFDSTNRVLILDACRNNPRSGRGNEDNVLTKNFSRDILAAAKASTPGLIPATCILHSCSLGQRAYEWHDQGHGAFTYYLLEGMRGKAYDERGRLTVQRLGCYVQEQVPRWSKKCAPNEQIPWSEQAGSMRTIYLAVQDAVAVQPDDTPGEEVDKVQEPQRHEIQSDVERSKKVWDESQNNQLSLNVETPKPKSQTVHLHEMLDSREFRLSILKLPLALGKDMHGQPKIEDLAHMPHLLVVGDDESGKSSFLNCLILSLLFRLAPEKLKLLLINLKRIDLTVYNNLPHLVQPVVTDMNLAKKALDRAVFEMETRINRMVRMAVRNIEGFNQKVDSMGGDKTECLEDMKAMPYLVIIIDEMADLMHTANKEVKVNILRLAQLGRLSGIHIVLATHSPSVDFVTGPSVDLVTGMIQACFPFRIAFQVSSKHACSNILDTMDAEYFLGNGNMLYESGGGQIQRLKGAFVEEKEIVSSLNFLKTKFM